jgi:hypothetical protein
MSAPVRVLEQFVSENEHAEILREIETHRASLRKTGGAAGLGPRYSVIAGDVIDAHLPHVRNLAERLLGEVESFGEAPAALFAERVRCMRVQCYEDEQEGFRWHFDGHAFAAVVTIENDADGVTEIIDERLSRFARPFFYLAYPFPRVFSLLPRRSLATGARDVLLLRGRDLLHRGRSRRAGRRTILVFAYDTPHAAPPPPWRNWIAKRLNF